MAACSCSRLPLSVRSPCWVRSTDGEPSRAFLVTSLAETGWPRRAGRRRRRARCGGVPRRPATARGGSGRRRHQRDRCRLCDDGSRRSVGVVGSAGTEPVHRQRCRLRLEGAGPGSASRPALHAARRSWRAGNLAAAHCPGGWNLLGRRRQPRVRRPVARHRSDRALETGRPKCRSTSTSRGAANP